jgi:D-arabinose 1-dehydrogenase-like Zn-dependent alcohol dehydrogenase
MSLFAYARSGCASAWSIGNLHGAASGSGPYEALVKMEACGICSSTDAKVVDGTMYWAPPFPLVLGHESVGRVVEKCVEAFERNWRGEIFKGVIEF